VRDRLSDDFDEAIEDALEKNKRMSQDSQTTAPISKYGKDCSLRKKVDMKQ
jgi:hypothetical protein